MNAVLLAGGIPKSGELLYEECQGQSKALLDVAGKPMVQWLLDALGESEHISNVLVIGLDASSALHCTKPLSFIPDGGGLLENILLGIQYIRAHSPDSTHVLLSSTDVPSVTTEIIDWRIEAAQEASAELDYAVVERSTMETRFPDAKRSYIHLQDIEICGGDMNIISVNLAQKTDLWGRLVAARKSVRRQAALLGYDLLLQVLARRITLKQGEEKISRRLGVKGRVVVSPYAELAMDVDKPEQLAIMRNDLTLQAGIQ